MGPDEEELRIIWNQQGSSDSALNSYSVHCHRKSHPLPKPTGHGFCRRWMKRWLGWGEGETETVSLVIPCVMQVTFTSHILRFWHPCPNVTMYNY